MLASSFLLAERHDPGPARPDKDRDGVSGYSRGSRDEGFLGSSERGPGRDRDETGGPSERDRSRGRVGTTELMEFLKKYEPELAEKLDKLRQEDERKFEWQISPLKRLYGPIMRMMDENPEMAKLSLTSIHLRVKIQETVKKAKEAADENSKKAAAKELQGHLGDLFDVIVSLEGMRLDGIQKRMQEGSSLMGSRRKGSESAVESELRERRGDTRRGQGGQGGRGEGRNGGGRSSGPGSRGSFGDPDGRSGFGGPGRGSGPGGLDHERFAEMMQSRTEQKKKNIEIWKKNKDKIIQQRIDELLKGIQPFPWGG